MGFGGFAVKELELGFRVEGSGFSGKGSRVKKYWVGGKGRGWGSGVRTQGSGFRIQGSNVRGRWWGLGFREFELVWRKAGLLKSSR